MMRERLYTIVDENTCFDHIDDRITFLNADIEGSEMSLLQAMKIG